ncbi:hypothetical protein [uncultured Lacinutrix sp.]|uniref:hypothetical protein n=1 Tax=uncultured Lacinutrix sp. TaxID=574032 RepID=UPI002614704F|nr:hypothetical protein [uncultured Lacinutrix sp.]
MERLLPKTAQVLNEKSYSLNNNFWMHMLLCNIACFCFIQNATSQVGISTTMPKAQLDIQASIKNNPTNTDGLLIPRIDTFPGVNPTIDQQSMLVYLTTTVGANEPGFYYWDNSIPAWIPFKSNDHDWYEENSTSEPDNINDDVYTQGNVAIGKTNAFFPLDVVNDASSSKALQVEINGNTNTSGSIFVTAAEIINSNETNDTQFGAQVLVSGDGNGIHYGIRNQLTGNGTGTKYAMSNDISGSGDGRLTTMYNEISNTSDGEHITVHNVISGNGNGTHTGFHNQLSGSGSGERIGSQVTISGSGDGDHFGAHHNIYASGTGDRRGVENFVWGSTTGDLYGVDNRVAGTSNSDRYGINNRVYGPGTGKKYGIKNYLNDYVTGERYGVYNQINCYGNDKHYGTYNTLLGGSGTNYGDYNEVSSSNDVYASYNMVHSFGTGTKYGVLSTISSSSSGKQYAIHATALSTFDPDVYAGYFVGKVSFGNATNRYVFPTTKGLAGQVLVTDASGILTWQNASAITARAATPILEGLKEENKVLKKQISEINNDVAFLKQQVQKLEDLLNQKN